MKLQFLGNSQYLSRPPGRRMDPSLNFLEILLLFACWKAPLGSSAGILYSPCLEPVASSHYQWHILWLMPGCQTLLFQGPAWVLLPLWGLLSNLNPCGTWVSSYHSSQLSWCSAFWTCVIPQTIWTPLGYWPCLYHLWMSQRDKNNYGRLAEFVE